MHYREYSRLKVVLGVMCIYHLLRMYLLHGTGGSKVCIMCVKNSMSLHICMYMYIFIVNIPENLFREDGEFILAYRIAGNFGEVYIWRFTP